MCYFFLFGPIRLTNRFPNGWLDFVSNRYFELTNNSDLLCTFIGSFLYSWQKYTCFGTHLISHTIERTSRKKVHVYTNAFQQMHEFNKSRQQTVFIKFLQLSLHLVIASLFSLAIVAVVLWSSSLRCINYPVRP